MERSTSLLSARLGKDPIRRGMLASVIEGCTFGIWSNALGGNYLTGMALYLGAGGFALGVLGSLSSFSTMLQLLCAPFVVGLVRRRNFLAGFSALQRFGAAIAGLLALALAPRPVALPLFVLLHAMAWACMAPSTVVWQGYMSDLVPQETRGRYFATRNSWGGAVGMVSVLVYGAILDRWPGAPGFRVLYWIAFAAAGLNLLLWFMHPELPQGDNRSSRSFWESIRIPLARPGAHLTTTFFFAAWAFAQGLAAPFFPVALMQKLGLSFSAVSILTTIASVTAILTVGFWGRLQDRIGQPKVVGGLTLMLAAVPLLLLAARFGGWPALIAAHILQGTASSGLGLANQTLNMQLAPSEDRTSYFAFFAAAGGITGFITPVVAGPFINNHLDGLFLASALFSAALSLLWWTRLQAPLTAHLQPAASATTDN